jgi:hypothetical protein
VTTGALTTVEKNFMVWINEEAVCFQLDLVREWFMSYNIDCAFSQQLAMSEVPLLVWQQLPGQKI